MGKVIQFPGPKPAEPDEFDKVVSILSAQGKALCEDCLGPVDTPYYVVVTQGERKWQEVCTNEFHGEYAGGPEVA